MPTLKDCPEDVLHNVFGSLSIDDFWSLSLVHRKVTPVAQYCLMRNIDLRNRGPTSSDFVQMDRATRLARLSRQNIRVPRTEATVGELLCRTLKDSPEMAEYIGSICCSIEEHDDRLVEIFKSASQLSSIDLHIEHGMSESTAPILALALQQLSSAVRVTCRVTLRKGSDIDRFPEHYFHELHLYQPWNAQDDLVQSTPIQKSSSAQHMHIKFTGEFLTRPLCSRIHPPVHLRLDILTDFSTSLLHLILTWSSPTVEELHLYRAFYQTGDINSLNVSRKPTIHFVKLKKLVSNTLDLAISPIHTVEVLELKDAHCLVPEHLREWITAKTFGSRLRTISLDPDLHLWNSDIAEFEDLAKLCTRLDISMDINPLLLSFRDLEEEKRKKDFDRTLGLQPLPERPGWPTFTRLEASASNSNDLLAESMCAIKLEK